MNPIIESLLEGGVIAVIRASSVEEAIALSKACHKGGIKGLEVTFTVPDADKVIKALLEEHLEGAIIGAGTVLDEATAARAIEAGASFIVSPGFDTGVASFCKNHAVPYIPGFLTPTEAMAALASGAELLKLFPGSLPGPNYIKALHGPFPHAKIMPTGGVSLDNVWDWIKNGAAAIGTGSNLTAPAKQGNYEEVTRLASEYVRLVKEARKAK